MDYSISSGSLGLRLIRLRDASEWRSLRLRNRNWLNQWDATSPIGGADIPPTFSAMVRALRAEARAGRTIPWVITENRAIVGQLTIGGIAAGSLRCAHAGYWVDQRVAGRGIAPTALAIGIDFCFQHLEMHRIEVNIRPENVASRRVVEKLGLRYEGLRERYLHINGQWRDHLSYAVTSEEVPTGLINRLHRARNPVPGGPGPISQA
ncbi:MAG: GNAT family N-acetyltransferase [Candidatus Nanopelagicales bacterium]